MSTMAFCGRENPSRWWKYSGIRWDANLVYVDAVDRFLDKLAGVADPETKRKIIGAEFIRVFEEEARKLEGIEFLAQGTIYPDILESGPVKAHHNVGGPAGGPSVCVGGTGQVPLQR